MLTVKLEEIRAKRAQLLDSVAMPLPGLVVEAGILKIQWAGMGLHEWHGAHPRRRGHRPQA